MQCHNTVQQQSGRAFFAPPHAFSFTRLLRLHGIAQRDRAVGGVANCGGNLNRTVAHRGFGGQDLVLHGLRHEGCKVFVRHDANAAFQKAEVDFLTPVGSADIPFVKEPNEGLTDVLEAGGQRDGRKIGGKRQFLIGVNADEVGFLCFERRFRSAVTSLTATPQMISQLLSLIIESESSLATPVS